MIHSPKVLWGEGLFLRPQHFQRQDAYHEWRLNQARQALHPYAWGLMHLRIDQDALQSGVLRVLEIRAILPDGEIVNAPGNDPLPAAVSLADKSLEGTEIVFHLALAGFRAGGGNTADATTARESGARYLMHSEPAADWYTRSAEADVVVLHPSACLVADHEPREHLVSLPVLKLRRSSTGRFELDARFMPPCISIESSAHLTLRLRRLLDALQAKCDALYGFHREPSKHIIEFRSGDVASFWLLHTAGSAYAELAHFLHQPGLHPERLFQALLGLAGALLTFSKIYRLSDLPTYDHHAPGTSFDRIDHLLRELLETVISTRYVMLVLQEVRPSFHQARLDAEQIKSQSQLILGVSAALPPTELVETVPVRFKVGAPDDVEKLVLSAMPGVPLVHLPQVPAAVPVKPNTYYFSLDARGSLYERMLQAQSLSLYVPSGLPDLQIELIAVSP